MDAGWALLLRAGQTPLEPHTGTAVGGNANRRWATPAPGGQPHGGLPADHL